MDVPFLVTDVGGISELVDMSSFGEAVVPEADSALLAARLQTTLERGYLPVLQLLPEVCERPLRLQTSYHIGIFLWQNAAERQPHPGYSSAAGRHNLFFCSFCYNKDESVVQQRLSRTGRVTNRSEQGLSSLATSLNISDHSDQLLAERSLHSITYAVSCRHSLGPKGGWSGTGDSGQSGSHLLRSFTTQFLCFCKP